MIEIRPYQPSDAERLRAICKATAPKQASSTEKKTRVLLNTYCDYYIEQEPQNCFVAVNTQDEAVGYILCAQDFHRYQKTYRNEYLPRIKGCGVMGIIEGWGSMFIHGLFRKRYPAHLHIDILEDYQRMGLGTRLVNTLTNHLQTQHIPGLMLVVSRDNQKGRSFYQKYGFREDWITPIFVVMGLWLS